MNPFTLGLGVKIFELLNLSFGRLMRKYWLQLNWAWEEKEATTFIKALAT